MECISDATCNRLLIGAAEVLLVLLLMYITKRIADWRTTEIDDDFEIEEKSNLAIGIRRSGLYLGVAIGFAGALGGNSLGLVADLSSLAADGVLLIALLFCARFINDKVMLNQIDNDQAAASGNVAVGVIECGAYITTGLVLHGAFSGSGNNLLMGLASSALFALLGQVVMLAYFAAYQQVLNFDLRAEIAKNNVAAATAVSGAMIALGFILQSSLNGPFLGWGADILAFAQSAGAGILLLLLFRRIVEKLFLPHTDLETEVKRDHNLAAIVMTEAVMIATSLVIAAVL